MSSQIYETQRKIYQHMKVRALKFESSANKGIAAYRTNYEKFSARKFTTSTHTELNNYLLKSNFIFVADFHTFDQSLKNLIRLLKLLMQKKKKVILALEMVSHNDTNLIHSYLKGYITELEFLESINFEKSWTFPWTHYRTIFDFVKKNQQIEIIGVNTSGTLLQRDKFCATLLAKKWANNPDKILVTLYGEYHLAPNKVPEFLKLELAEKAPKTRLTVVHQNLDHPYWKLLKKTKNLSHDLIIKYNTNEFCLLTSPPWMKFESMAYWYENLYDDPDYDINQYIIENGLKVLSSNAADNFIFLCRQLIVLFQLPIDPNDLSFTLYDYGKIDFIENFIKTHYKKTPAIKVLRKLLQTQHSLILPDTEKIYCASYSANKLIKLAGNFLYQIFCNNSGIKITPYFLLKSNQSLFCYHVISNFHSYFMAKSINPYIKCDLYLDLKNKKNESKGSPDNAAAMTVVKILDQPKKIGTLTKNLDIPTLCCVAKMLGELIAENAFHQTQSKFKHFDSDKWKRNFLNTNHTIKMVAELINLALVNKDFKNQRKRYY